MTQNATVGREYELKHMEVLLAATVAGRGRTCFISGDAGSGKSTLVQEYVSRALNNRKVVVAIGSCYAMHGISDPYLPFVEIIAALTGDDVGSKLSGRAAGRLRRFANVAGRVLLEVAPELLGPFIPYSAAIARLMRVAAEKRGNGKIDKEQIFKSYTKFLRRLTAHSPVVIILDDMHWADESSCSLFYHLARAMSDARLLLSLIHI